MNMRNYISYIIKGMAIGVANAIPGVSGGTIAFVLGIYENLTYAISILPTAIIKLKWKEVGESLKILVPVFFGAGISIVLFFVGLILGSFPFVTKTIDKFDFKVFISFFIGAFIMAIFVYFDINKPAGETTYTGDFSIFYGIKLFLCGIAAAVAMVIPGISGSLLLLILGEYENVSNLVSTLTKNFANVYPLIFLGLGVAIGIFTISKLVTIVIQKHKSVLFGFVLGIIVVSFLSLWPNITTLSLGMLTATVLSMCFGFLIAMIMEKI